MATTQKVDVKLRVPEAQIIAAALDAYTEQHLSSKCAHTVGPGTITESQVFALRDRMMKKGKLV